MYYTVMEHNRHSRRHKKFGKLKLQESVFYTVSSS